MRILLGEEEEPEVLEKLAWIQHTFETGSYKIIADGFLINDFFVTFKDPTDATLFLLKWS